MIMKQVVVNVYIDTDDEKIANEVLENCDYGFMSETEGVKILNTEIVDF